MHALQLRLLGRPSIGLEGIDVTRQVPPKHQALLFYLAVAAEPVSRSKLAALLWGRLAEDAARGNLRVALSKLRAFCPGALEIDAAQVELAAPVRHSSDYAELVSAARVVSRNAALPRDEWPLGRLITAVEHRRGAFLDGLVLADAEDFETWMQQLRAQVDRAAISVRWYLAERSESLGNRIGQGDAIEQLRAILRMDDLDEAAHMQLMRLLAATGQRIVALAQYEVCKVALAQKLGAKPSADCYALYARIHGGQVEAPTVLAPVGANTELETTLHAAHATRAVSGSVPRGRPGQDPQAFERFVELLHLDSPRTQDDRSAQALDIRSVECQWLRAPHVGVTLLEGDPGMGKSTVLAQAFPSAGWLRCRESLTNLPLHPLAEFLRQHHEQLAARAGIHRSELARLVPEFLDGDPPALDATLGKSRLFGALYSAAKAVCRILVVDDLQWADMQSLEWLAYAIEQDGLQVVLARRSGERMQDEDRLLQVMSGNGRLRLLKLAPLADEVILALLRGSRPAREAPAAKVPEILRLAAGNPFFAIELMHHVTDDVEPAESARIDARATYRAVGDSPGGVAAMAIPDRVLRHIESRLAHLSNLQRGLLVVLAVADEMGLPDTVVADLAGMTKLDLQDVQEQLQARAWIQAQRFSHDLLRQCVYATLPARRRLQLHLAVARAAVHALTLGWRGQAAQIAHHFHAAREVEQALQFEFLAAQHLRELGNLDKSVQRFSEIARASGDSILQLRCRAATAEHMLLSDLATGQRELEDLLAAAQLVPDSPAQRELLVRIRTGLADNAIYRGDLAAAGAHIDTLMPMIDGIASGERLHALEIVIDVSMRRGDHARAHEALKQARREPACGAVFDISEAMLAYAELRLADAVAGFERVVHNHPDHARYLMVENDCALAHLLSGQVVAAESWLRRSLVTWAGVPHAECLAKLNLGTVLSSAGRWSQARHVLVEALELAREQHSSLFEGETLHRLARLAMLTGHFEAAYDHVSGALGCLDVAMDPVRVGQWHAAAVPMALALSSHEAALAHLTAAQRSLACVDLPMPALRLKRAQVVHALAHGEWRAAMAWTEQMFAVSQRLGLDEITADALLLQARCIAQDTGDVSAAGLAGRALDMAARRELLPLRWRACGVLMDLSSDPACAAMFESDSQLLCRHGDLDIGALRASSRIEPAFRAG